MTSTLQEALAYKVRAIATSNATVDGASPQWIFASSGTLDVLPDRLRYRGLEIAFSDISSATLIAFPNSFVLTLPWGARVHQFAVMRDEFWEGDLPFPVQRGDAPPPSTRGMMIRRALRFAPIVITALVYFAIRFLMSHFPDANPPSITPVQAFVALVVGCVAAAIGWLALRGSSWARACFGLALGLAATAATAGLAWFLGNHLAASGSIGSAFIWLGVGALSATASVTVTATAMALKSAKRDDKLYGIELLWGSIGGAFGSILILLVALTGLAANP